MRTSEDPADYHRAAYDEASIDTWREVIARFPSMRFWVAQNKTIPSEVIAQLAHDEDSKVRSMVARKRRLEPVILQSLASDPDDGVRMAVARNRHTPRPVLESLALHDPWPEVRRAASARI